ncbi:glycosyl hydrolase [Thermophagus sp. OGC60D27]|uniref:glycosyl hydrolase n=1 Tax=Thermophagus sp. OGC60D27 TaxID=3458415 RepID=UPI004037C3EB
MVKWVLIFCTFLLFFLSGCGEDNNENVDKDTTEAPALTSSIPSDQEKDVDYKLQFLKLYFDRDILLIKASRILLNEEGVSNASVDGNTLTIEVNSLTPETEYQLLIQPLAIKTVNGGVNSEEIVISFVTGEKQEVTITPTLSVTSPSPEAQNVYNFLKASYGISLISSTMANVNWNINEAEWVRLHTGKYPAMANFDYIHLPYSPANWIDYSNTTVVEEWWQNNGLVGACWHWLVPKTEGATEYTYRSAETSFRAANATVNGTWENDVVKADLNKIAGYLKLLRDKNIPIIWRPLHEASGNIYEYDGGTAWFWWGYDGAEAFKNLWIYMFEFFEEQGLNNLIWVWTTQTNDEAFYPGDDYVDIIGRDIYNESDASFITSQFESIQTAFPNKIITLSEMGGVPDISDQWAAMAKWSWFMPWYDYERTNDPNGAKFNETDHEFADIAWWQNAFNHDAVISRDEMPNLK